MNKVPAVKEMFGLKFLVSDELLKNKNFIDKCLFLIKKKFMNTQYYQEVTSVSMLNYLVR